MMTGDRWQIKGKAEIKDWRNEMNVVSLTHDKRFHLIIYDTVFFLSVTFIYVSVTSSFSSSYVVYTV